MKKAFLTKAVVISVLALDLVAGGLKIGGVISDGIGQAPIGTLIRALHDGSFSLAAKEEPEEENWEPIETTQNTESEDAAEVTASLAVTESTEAAQLVIMDTETEEEDDAITGNGDTYSFTTVDDSYFADACMIGDSRAGCVEYWDGMPGMVYHTVAGYSIYEILDKSWCEYNGQKCTLEQSLSYDYDKFGKVYVETGINGASYDTLDEWKEYNQEMIDLIKETQPHAIIFLCACLRVTYEMSNASDPVVTNKQINEHNDVLKELCDNQTVFYLEINDYCCDADGYLMTDYSSDGYHLTYDYTYLWKDCFTDHGVVRNE